jgi:hypothetical protein
MSDYFIVAFLGLPFGLAVIYLAVRLASAAYFQSKQDFERKKDGAY